MTSLTMWLLLGMFVAVTCGSLRYPYNSPVMKAEWMIRPKSGYSSFTYPITAHSGVRVTLGDGHQFMIHKGFGYGPGFGHSKASDTVVFDATYLHPRWRGPFKTKYLWGRKKVIDFVKAGGHWYFLLGANCHDAAEAMMSLKK